MAMALANLVWVVLTGLCVSLTGLLGVAWTARLPLVSLGLLSVSLAIAGCLLAVPARWLVTISLAGLLAVAGSLTLAPAGATRSGAAHTGLTWALSLPG